MAVWIIPLNYLFPYNSWMRSSRSGANLYIENVHCFTWHMTHVCVQHIFLSMWKNCSFLFLFLFLVTACDLCTLCTLCRLYYVTIRLGNPAKEYFLDMDTGSELTWLQCDVPGAHCAKVYQICLFLYKYYCEMEYVVSRRRKSTLK
jgi:hypothetical protein